MNIMHVITGLGLGGAERVVCDLADQQVKEGNSVCIVVLNGDVVTRPLSKYVEIFEINMKKDPSGFFKASKEIKEIAKIKSSDVIHSHMYHAIILTRMISFGRAVKIGTFHNAKESSKIRLLSLNVTRFLCNAVTAVSPDAAINYRAKCIPNGINISRLTATNRIGVRDEIGVGKDTFLFGYVGRLHADKNVQLLINCFKEVIKGEIDCHLLIVGEGPEENTLKNLSAELGISDRVTFYGKTPEVSRIYGESDLVVIPSLLEGFGIVAAESLFMKCPVLSMDNIGVPYVIENDDFICKTEFELTNKMKYLLRNRVSEENLNHMSSSIYNRFSLDTVSQMYRDLYI